MAFYRTVVHTKHSTENTQQRRLGSKCVSDSISISRVSRDGGPGPLVSSGVQVCNIADVGHRFLESNQALY